jgi:hypothetical protein
MRAVLAGFPRRLGGVPLRSDTWLGGVPQMVPSRTRRPTSPNELILINPLGRTVTYFRED